MTPQIKICCISSVAEARLANTSGATFLGFVGPMPSGPGTLAIADIAGIVAAYRAETTGGATPVLLSSAETADQLIAEADATGIDHLQVVSHVAPKVHREMARRRPDLRRWQVIHVEDAGAVDLARLYAPLSDGLLLDSGRPSAGELGGTGRRHDWSLSRACVEASAKPVFLAGGLHPDNVRDAVVRVEPAGVDICSGLRNAKGLNPALLSAFVSNLRVPMGNPA